MAFFKRIVFMVTGYVVITSKFENIEKYKVKYVSYL